MAPDCRQRPRGSAALSLRNAPRSLARKHEAMDRHSEASALTAGQRAQLRERLELRQHELDRRIAELGGARAQHASELLEQDGDDAPQRDADREVDLARSDALLQEQGAVSRALSRLDEPGFGRCIDCALPIAFDRLRIEPWALRCVACESAREGAVRPPRL
jgi:DnaK suppressor protein